MLFYYPEILNNKDIISAYKAAAMLCVISNKKVPLETVVFFSVWITCPFLLWTFSFSFTFNTVSFSYFSFLGND